MINGIIGKKIEQTQVFLADGTRIPATIIDIADNTVLAVKTDEKHGYTAVQLGYGSRKKAPKSLMGQLKKVKVDTVPFAVYEIRLNDGVELPEPGSNIDVKSVLKPGDVVKVTGMSKGKGFAGVVKRHHFRGGPRTHGQSDRERAPGSIGQTTTPGRVYRGKRMAGRMGHVKSSALNLQIVGISTDGDKKTLLVKGLVPGSVNSIVVIKKTGELPERKFVPLANPAMTDNTAKTEIAESTDEKEIAGATVGIAAAEGVDKDLETKDKGKDREASGGQADVQPTDATAESKESTGTSTK